MQGTIKHCNESKEYFFEEGCFILELSNYPEDPHVSIARARVEAGRKTRLHRLIDTIERYIILEGSGLVEIGYEAPQAVNAGDVVLIPALCPQCITNTGNTDLIFLAICTPRFRKESYQELQE